MTKRSYDDDDGRVVADMSGLERQPMLLPRLPKRKKENAATTPEDAGSQQPELQLSAEERRSYMAGAVGAGLLIAGIFIAAGAVAIALLLFFWR